jgi:cardiolipin synthase
MPVRTMPVWLPNLSALEHGAFVVAGLLLYVLATRLGRQRRHPSAAIAWVLGIAAFPYVGVPLFLLFGTRKFARPPRAAAGAVTPPVPTGAPRWAGRLLGGLGVAPPVALRAASFQPDGARALSGLLALCEAARERLDVGTYLLGNDQVGSAVAAALSAAAARGVVTRLLLDSVGSLTTSRQSLRRLQQAGVQVRRFMPLLHNPMRGRSNLRNHRKVVIADGIRLWSGGRNLADEYFAMHDGAGDWVDLSFVVDGAAATQAQRQFDDDWRGASGTVAAHAFEPVARAADDAASAALAQWIASGPDWPDDTLHALLMTAAYQANERVLAVSPYFVPDDALLDAWCTACRRGVKVDLIVPRRSNHHLADWARERALRSLVHAGGHVWLADTMVHAKVVVIDAQLALCGSLNLDSRSLFLNYEAMMAFYGAAEVEWLTAWADALLRRARPHAGDEPGLWRDLGEGIVRAVGFQL